MLLCVHARVHTGTLSKSMFKYLEMLLDSVSDGRQKSSVYNSVELRIAHFPVVGLLPWPGTCFHKHSRHTRVVC